MPIFIVVESTLVDREGNPILGSDGKPVDRVVKHTNSWVKNFPLIMKSSMQEISESGGFDTAGNARIIDRTPDPILDASAPAADDDHGILVGTSTTTPTETDTNLNTKIAEGTAGGQLEHQVMIFPVLVNISGGRRVVCSRQFDNNSGGLITVEEIGLVVRQRTTIDISFMLILHDLITQAIADATSRVFTYNLEYLV